MRATISFSKIKKNVKRKRKKLFSLAVSLVRMEMDGICVYEFSISVNLFLYFRFIVMNFVKFHIQRL